MQALKHAIYKDTRITFQILKRKYFNTDNVGEMTQYVKNWVSLNASKHHIDPERVMHLTVACHLIKLSKGIE